MEEPPPKRTKSSSESSAAANPIVSDLVAAPPPLTPARPAPVRVQGLNELRSYLRAAAASGATPSDLPPAVPNLPPVAWEQAMEQACGDVDFLCELLKELWVEVSQIVGDLRAEILTRLPAAVEPAARHASCKAIVMCCHTLCGSSGNLMCSQMAEMARWLSQEALECIDPPVGAPNNNAATTFPQTAAGMLASVEACRDGMAESLRAKGIPAP
jgi:hypothetical protein